VQCLKVDELRREREGEEKGVSGSSMGGWSSSSRAPSQFLLHVECLRCY
jgi:hypothetical protein